MTKLMKQSFVECLQAQKTWPNLFMVEYRKKGLSVPESVIKLHKPTDLPMMLRKAKLLGFTFGENSRPIISGWFWKLD
jgi:hypothetical protein